MKILRKLQHGHPTRQSPRLSSSPAAAAAASALPSTPLSGKAETGPDDGWALSLHVAEQQPTVSICYPVHTENNSVNSVRRSARATSNKYKIPPPEKQEQQPQQQQPVSICYAVHVEDNSVKLVRRSTRTTSNKYKIPPPEGSRSKSRSRKHTALVLAELSPPPIIFSSSPAPALTLTEDDNVGSGKAGAKKRRRLSEDRVATGKTAAENDNSVLRLQAATEWNSKSGSRGCLSERSLRSRTVLMHIGGSGDFSINERRLRSRAVGNAVAESQPPPEASERSERRERGKAVAENALIVLPEDNELCRKEGEMPQIGMLTLPEKSPLSTEKCLRSRTVKMELQEGRKAKVASVKNASVKSAGDSLIELPENDVPQIRMLTLPEKSPISSEKCLRSRTVKMQLQEERKERVPSVKKASLKSSSGIELNKKSLATPKKEPFSGESADKGQCDFEGMSEKQLRSREIQLKLNVDEKNAVTVYDPIGGGCNGESAKPEKHEKNTLCCFTGEPIPEEEARERWQWRYDLKSRKRGKKWKINADGEDEVIWNVESHYAQAKVGNVVLNIGDCVFVKGEGNKKHIGRILEFFKTTEGEDYFRVQWFFRAEDTVLKETASPHDKRRIFYSTLLNDNLLDCIISKVKIVEVPPTLCLKRNQAQSAAFYYDMEYSVEYSTFRTLVTETSESQSLVSTSNLPDDGPIALTPLVLLPNYDSSKQELSLLDLYSGCGGMSTGLCLGAKLSSVNLVTKWAVDLNSAACESLKLNHPETNVRNESADDFLDLLKQWEKLCKKYISDIERTLKFELEELPEAEDCPSLSDTEDSSGEYEVSHLVGICYGDPNERGKRGLHFKVRWKGYGPKHDTWEGIEGLNNCQERIEDFVRRGFSAKILPLPGDVGVICGGPPCQGISGYNRHRNFDSPLSDDRNRQIVVFMDIVEFLKPKFCLMENVVDIIKFDKGSLGRYALSRLVRMKYQARLGTIASGCYGLPQFRLRVFIWGAHPAEKLPQFPLPTHDVVVKYWPPIEFERNVVAYDEGQPRPLQDAVVLRDSISDLPPVTNDETREEMAYEKPPETEFQKHIRLRKDEMMGQTSSTDPDPVLYDHRSLKLSIHDYMRVSQVPHRKGANFRDLEGVVVGEDNVARRDPTREPVMLPTGRPLIPDSVFTHEQGKSRRPYARLWWDETVSTVITFPHIRAQAILHPEQDRPLTIRECARLQGFPDYYRFCGTTKERYCQIGNAVSIPVSRALGYALGMAYRKNVVGDGPLMTLPPDFASKLPSS